ncbi:hypothetical protein [Phytoactinopolyspora limicola]|uniref:hypothetical protein n=1 Tax=Phytoactinopolyspora limicola TaxID=2715536 RepID=UPI001A9C2D94|nr:hypothetical protein [Phytoactinopolyspora limicola]
MDQTLNSPHPTGSPARSDAPAQSASAALARSTRAELFRLSRWPVLWVLVGVWLVLNLLFAYVFSYLAYRSGSGAFGTADVAPDRLLADLAPEAIPRLLTNGMPMFGGAIMLILGALATGSGYGWGTWKTAALQGPGRPATMGGTLLSLAVVVVGVVAATFVTDLGSAVLISSVESQTLAWPELADTARALGGSLLIFAMWTAAGAMIGVVTRSPAVGVGLGLVWALAVENLLRGVAGVLDGLEYVTDLLPGTAAGSMAGALGGMDTADGDGAPGVLTVLDGGPAALLLAGYAVVAAVVTVALASRRDVE